MSQPHRRDLLSGALAAGLAFGAGAARAAMTGPERPGALLVTTTEAAAFRQAATPVMRSPFTSLVDMDVMVREDAAFQTIKGFGGCFNELGWVALSGLSEADRATLLDELFAPGKGANLTVCRLPIGATDFARSWYSLDETAGDFDMAHFSIARDRQMLIPYVKAAQARRPDLALWASPWSPPTWMKRNGHYASVRPPVAGWPDNGLRPDQVGHEGQDMFVLEDRYLAAYALYFRRFVEAYRAEGVPIGAVMPQNEFNSAQPFPSCCWTPEGLARFIPYLGREMEPLGVEVVFGTLERGDDRLFERVYADPAARRYIKGVAAQWAGRRAIPFIHHAHPDLRIYQSEQECGDGRNDWRFARYSFSMMRAFLEAGAEVYDYWSLAAPAGGVSTWGWPQNAMISVDAATHSYTFNPDYWVFKHLSHFIQPGARRVDTLSVNGFEDMIAFMNPDGGIALVLRNAGANPQTIRAAARGEIHTAVLAPDSISTLVI